MKLFMGNKEKSIFVSRVSLWINIDEDQRPRKSGVSSSYQNLRESA
jgi:hypothetical protein